MATQSELKILRKHLIRDEGNINHLYLDSKNNVTIGVGHLIKNLAAAQKLLLYTLKGKKATPANIKLDFDTIKKHPNLNRFRAPYYKQFTLLNMKAADIQAQLNAHIVNFEKELKRLYTGFSSYPKEVRLALFDMIFNLGYPRLKNKYPKMNAAIAKKDWFTAANECHRNIQSSRNIRVQHLFLKAHKQNQQKKKSAP